MPGQEETEPAAQTIEAAPPPQETLRSNFQRQSGNYFLIDLDPYENAPASMALDEIRSDPSLAEHLTGPHIYTDDINDQLFKDGLGAQINFFTTDKDRSVQEVLLSDRENVRAPLIRAGEQFMSNLHETAPELHALIERDIEQRMPRLAASYGEKETNLTPDEVRAMERVNTANTFLNNYFVQTFYLLDNPAENTLENAMKPDGEVVPPKGTKTVVAFLPGSNFSFADATLRHPSLQEAKNPAPGTNEEWAALVTAHETEHFIDASKDRDPKIMPPEMKAILDLMPPETKTMFSTMQDIQANMREAESDMSSANAVAGQTTPDLLPYLAALRIGDSMLQTMPRLIGARAYSDENSRTFIPNVMNSHDTGYVLNEYLVTGNIPEYLDMVTPITGFYEKTAEQYIQRARGPLEEAGRQGDALNNMKTLTLSDTVDLVQRTLAQDPPVYTPQEAQIAQSFVDNMTGPLGIERGNIDLAIKNSIEALPAAQTNDAKPEIETSLKIGGR